MLGRTAHGWDDMSADVIHLTRGNESASFENLISILGRKVIEARNPFGAGRKYCPDVRSQHAVCFTEVPVHRVIRLIQRRVPEWWNTNSWNGIGFSKTFIAGRGGGPVLYAYHGSPQAIAVETMMSRAMQQGPTAASDPIWKLTPFVDLPGKNGNYWWEWEREWRHVGDLHFEMRDISFLIVPERYHADARNYFLLNHQKGLDPVFWGHFIDANWTYERCQEILSKIRRPPPQSPAT